MKTLLTAVIALLLCTAAHAQDGSTWDFLHRSFPDAPPPSANLAQVNQKADNISTPALERFTEQMQQGERTPRIARIFQTYASRDEGVSAIAARWIYRVPAHTQLALTTLKEIQKTTPAPKTKDERTNAALLAAAIAGVERQAKESGVNQPARDAVRAWLASLPAEPKIGRK